MQIDGVAEAGRGNEAEGEGEEGAQRVGGVGTRRVVLANTLASLMTLPNFQDLIRPVSGEVVAAVGLSQRGVLAAAERGTQHIAPALMSELQDAISCLYYVLQRHGAYLASDSYCPYAPDEDVLPGVPQHVPAVQCVPGSHLGRTAVLLAASAMITALKV